MRSTCRGLRWIVLLNVRRLRMFRSCTTSGLVQRETYEDLLKKTRQVIFTPTSLPSNSHNPSRRQINPALAEARARGVIFDVGHGAGSFWFRNAVPAQKQGFIPDSMSTDLHTGDYNVVSMTIVMSKFLAMVCLWMTSFADPPSIRRPRFIGPNWALWR